MKIDGSIAVVTGASSGIGAVTAEALAAKGATVVAAARRVDKLESVIERCRVHAPDSMAHAADVAVRGDCQALVRAAEERFGRVDIVVNNAGQSIHRNAAKVTAEETERLMEINFFGAVRVTSAALGGMVARGRGAIVNVTSVAGYLPNPGEAAYGASKAALSMWTHGLSVDLHGTGVQASVVSPGPIDTEIWSLDEELSYTGKLYPASVVADGVVRVIERGSTHLTVPRRFGAAGAVYPLVGRPFRWGLRKYGG